jgi:transcriptional regulator with XRE-family HTH domain
MSDKEILKNLGKRIANLRIEKGFTQNELADLIDIERSNLARVEAGNTNPTYLTLLKIAIALSISVSELVDLE